MRIRFFGLVMAGGVVLGAWIAVSPAAAAPKDVVELPLHNLSWDQRQEINGWYKTLGRFKREGLAALKRGDCPTVDDYIKDMNLIVSHAEKGDSDFAPIPKIIRNQIAKTGHQVIAALSVHCDSIIDKRLREAMERRAREAKRKAEAAKKKDDNVFYLVGNFFKELAPKQAIPPRSSRRKTATVQRRPPSGTPRTSLKAETDFASLIIKAVDRTERQISDAKQRAFDALRYRQPAKFKQASDELARLARGYLPHFATIPKRSARRLIRLAREALKELPEKFVVGFAYQRSDGSIAADPDPFIQSQLARQGDSARDGGDGSGGGGAD